MIRPSAGQYNYSLGIYVLCRDNKIQLETSLSFCLDHSSQVGYHIHLTLKQRRSQATDQVCGVLLVLADVGFCEASPRTRVLAYLALFLDPLRVYLSTPNVPSVQPEWEQDSALPLASRVTPNRADL
jgi:hypothetical protein